MNSPRHRLGGAACRSDVWNASDSGSPCFSAILLVFGWAGSVHAGNTYTNDIVNVSVTEPDCTSFEIVVSQASGDYAVLTLRVRDVDEEQGELDEVYLNGVYLGYLSGTNDTWSTTTFDVSGAVYYSGENSGINTVEICIDPGGGESNSWVAEVDWGQLLIDGGGAEDAAIISLDADGTWDLVRVDTLVQATSADTFRLEINLLDSTYNNKDIAVDTFALTEGETSMQTLYVGLPSEPTETETFTIEANLFNETTGVQQSLETTTWVYEMDAAPTAILLSNDHVEENESIGILVGTLSAEDPDSFAHIFTLVGGDVDFFSVDGDELRTLAVLDYEEKAVYTISVQAEDENLNTYTEDLVVYVDDVNDAPILEEGEAVSVSLDEDSAPTPFLLVLHASDEDGDILSWALSVAANHGTADASGVGAIVDVSYVPDADYAGPDSFGIEVSDGRGGVDEITVDVTVLPVNDTPEAVTDTYSIDQDEELIALPGVLSNDSDIDGDLLSADLVTQPVHGRIEWNADGSFVYRPTLRYAGSDGFSYRASDGQATSESTTVEIEIRYVNHPPFADAGGPYAGDVGMPILLSAAASSDPDLTDRLQYRWDFDDDWNFDTDWLDIAAIEHSWDEPVSGLVTLQVRDLFENEPTGTVIETTAIIEIASVQTIRALVFEDVDADGTRGSSEPVLDGISLVVAGQSLVSGPEGTEPVRLEPGSWPVAVADSALSQLVARGYTVVTPSISVILEAAEDLVVRLAVAKLTTKLSGTVYVDDNGNGAWDDGELPAVGWIVTLGDGRAAKTNARGEFIFLRVPFGIHALVIAPPGSGVGEGVSVETVALDVSLVRGERLVLEIPWAIATAEGPREGFLKVDVENP